MLDKQHNEIHYKWNPKTESGFRLRFDAQRARRGGPRCFHVEDWTDHVVVDEWGCNSLDEALDVLSHFFIIDVGLERHRLEECFPLHA